MIKPSEGTLWISRMLGLGLVYAASGLAGMQLPHYVGRFTLFWMPAGFAVAALWRWGVNLWPGVFLGSLFISVAYHDVWPMGTFTAAANTLGAVACVHLLRRWKFDPSFRRFRDLLVIALAASGGMLACASFGSWCQHLFGRPDAGDLWLMWWQSDTTGVLLLTPLLLTAGPESWKIIQNRRREFLLCLAGTMALGGLLLWSDRRALTFLAMIPPVWGAMRFGSFGTALAVFLIGGCAILSVALDVGQLALAGPGAGLLDVSLFLAAVLVLSWLVYALQNERDRQETELRGSEARYRRAEHGTNDGIWEWNITTGEEYFSTRWLEMLGYARGELAETVKSFAELIHPDDRAHAWAESSRSVREGGPFSVEMRLRRKDGTYLWVLSRAQTDREADGKTVRMTGTITDLTGRKQAEAEILASRQQLAATLDAIPDLLFETGPDSRIHQYRSPRTDLLLAPPEKFLGQLMTDFVPAETAGVIREALREALAHGRSLGRQYCVPLTQGLRWFELSIARKPAGPGQEPRFIIIARDITERKALDEQLRQNQKLEVVGQLAGGVAHEYNNLLTAILGHAALLQQGGSVTVEQKASLDQIELAGKRAAELTYQLLLFGRQQHPDKQVLDLNQVVTRMADTLGSLLGGPRQLHLDCARQPQWVCADAGMLDQILLILALNARDAMPAGGRLSIRTENGAARPGDAAPNAAPGPVLRRWLDPNTAVTHPGGLSGEYTCLSVADQGCGMAPEILDRIFQPFFTTKDIGRCTGLGLATVHGIVLQHQGCIEVESLPGRGSTFRILLPRSRETKSPPPPAPTAVPIPADQGQTILLVEDVAPLRHLLHTILSRANYRVIECPHGDAALALWPRCRAQVDLLLTDIIMPGLVNGTELARQLRADQPDLKVILMSGYQFATPLPPSEFGPGMLFIAKPFTSSDILGAVRQQLAPARN